MSTTFEIYPSSSSIPSFQEVRERLELNFYSYLSKHSVKAKPKIFIKLLTKKDNIEIEIDNTSPFSWSEETYIWVHVSNIEGGTDGYFSKTETFDREYWYEDIIPLERNKSIKKLLQRCISQKYNWSFCRSAGQPAVINILYGILSGTVAELTGGVVFSDDSAWDYNRMPMQGTSFLEAYMSPEVEETTELKVWAQDNIDRVIIELRT